jgi:1,4-dihydroxy-2-naphthoyl-CoA hydrolase
MTSIQERLNSETRTGTIEFFFEERHVDYVISRMPVTPGILNPFGVVQAGAMIWLADVTASVLAVDGQPVGEDGKGFPLAIDVHTNLVGNQRDGEIKAEARFVRRGKSVMVVRTRVTGNGDKLLAEVTSTHIKAR